ncbi:MAG: VCBS repeat-containing protein [Planctomycetota bacterium]
MTKDPSRSSELDVRPLRRAMLFAVALTIGCEAQTQNSERVRLETSQDPILVGSMPNTPILCDLDGDGDLDVLVVCGPCCGREPLEDSGHLQVLENDGRGTLEPRAARTALGPTALGGVTGDFDEDGVADFAAFHHQSYEVQILLGDGDCGFTRGELFELHSDGRPHVHSLQTADVNDDGHLDLCATLVDDHALAVQLGDGAGSFRPALGQPFFAHRHPYMGLHLEDLDLDGSVDALMTDVRGHGITLLVGSGTGMFSPKHGFAFETSNPLGQGERPIQAAVGDLNGDQVPDLVAFLDESDRAIRMLGTGPAEFAEPEEAEIDLGVRSVGGLLFDLDGDDRLDLVASGTGTARIGLCFGLEAGRFSEPVTFQTRGLDPRVAAGDLNGDHRPDLVVSHYEFGTLEVLLQR